MHTITVPYHLDEWLPDLDLPFEAVQTVTATLSAGDGWDQLAVLYQPDADPNSTR